MEEILGGLPLAFPPLVEVWLEQSLVELGHASERSSAVKEVEFLVILLVHLGVFLFT